MKDCARLYSGTSLNHRYCSAYNIYALTDPPRCGQPPYNGQRDSHRLILACVLCIFNLRETHNCNLSVPDNGHSARPRMIAAVQKKPLRADRLKATPSRTREGVAPRVYRGYYGVVSTFYSFGM